MFHIVSPRILRYLMISAGHAWPKDEPEVRIGECRCQSAYGDWAEIFPASGNGPITVSEKESIPSRQFSGWWFGTWLSFFIIYGYIWDNPSH
jgi:hypothetical protein